MVVWHDDQVDEFGRQIMKYVEDELQGLSKPAADFVSIVQTGEEPSPVMTIRTQGGLRSFQIAYEDQADGTAEGQYRQKIRAHLLSLYRGDKD
jgi:hypothetical protein